MPKFSMGNGLFVYVINTVSSYSAIVVSGVGKCAAGFIAITFLVRRN